MKPIQVGLLGIGTVGGGVFTVLERNQDEILRRADQAMYRAKNAGGGRVEVCRR
jgi:homoserine dehydrogenase